jgi:hypothetical protein
MSLSKVYRSRHGFASFSAVVLVGTTAIALTALAGVTVLQLSRTKNAATDAQLRQLLHAGQAYLADQDGTQGKGAFNIDVRLPEPLAQEGATLSIETKSAEPQAPLTAIIRATHRTRDASASLIYDQAEGRWIVDTVQLP